MSRHLAHRRTKSDINVTPLVDVVLVLLIVFMVVAPLLRPGKPVALPEAQRASEPRAGAPILVSLTRDKRIWLDDREVRKGELAEALGARMARAPGAPVVLRGDRDLDYRTIREVVGELSETHAVGLFLATSQPKSRGGK